MSEIMRIQPFATQLRRILKEYQATDSIFGIHKSFFYTPRPDARFATADVYGQYLATPIGPSAGPHTQLSQNIVAAWLTGGRFIELKTVQIMDELEIPRPCIDMEDEGYNVEWSQELKLEQSAHEYVVAWALLHILPRVLGWDPATPFGAIFDMSVGYNLEGIQTPRMQTFMNKMADASAELAVIRDVLRREFPEFATIEIPSRITNSVTLSTMHGCPPDEIDAIARYLMVERGLHTIVKMNPTLLGKEQVLEILNNRLGFSEIEIPDSVFEHDLKYERAVELIHGLKQVGAERSLVFGIKLSNTLAMHNHKERMPGEEMYMSGRALYPVTMNLYNKLMHEFKGDLRVSYSAGADALNIATILSCGPLPVTACSDLLKPGGYARFQQWLENLDAAMEKAGAANLEEFSKDRLRNVEIAAGESLTDHRYKKEAFPFGLPKMEDGLELFDCIAAPCMEKCAVCQDVPEYNWWIAQGDPDKSLEVILRRNPMPGVTGYVCTHLCQTRCVRNDYEETVGIRALKRYAEEHGKVRPLLTKERVGKKVAIIGSGPAGFSAAFYLALSGVDVTMFEAKDVLGGMMRLVPVFRLPWEVIQRDVDRILDLGVKLEFNHPIIDGPEKLLQDGFDAVFVGAGFQKDTPLRIPGVDGPGVFAALNLLDRTRRGERPDLGKKALVIGGGDTAMDAVRTSARLTGNPTTIVYRRTRAEMPASPEELEGALEENNILMELVSPLRIVRNDAGDVVALECQRNELGEPGPDGRRKPIAVLDSEFQIPCDSVIIAVGQNPDFEFLGAGIGLTREGGIDIDPLTGATKIPGVYAGGDAAEAGPESIIAACEGGRKAAEAMCRQWGVEYVQPPSEMPILSNDDIIEVKHVRARKIEQEEPGCLPVPFRTGFDMIELTLTPAQAVAEAKRCVQCTTFCDKCVEVCPNRANHTFLMQPVHANLPVLLADGVALSVQPNAERFHVAQTRQILNVNDFCNECGDCETFCVHEGRPFREKPRLFLDEGDFQKETSNAFHLDTANDGSPRIRRREEGQESSLTLNGSLVYETDLFSVTMTHAFEVEEVLMKQPFKGTVSLKGAAEMSVIYKGIAETLPQYTIA
jgi:putative selenate reductase